MESQNPPLLKAEKIAYYLKDKTVFFVNIETPDGKGSTIDERLEASAGIIVSAESRILTFAHKDRVLRFDVLENSAVIPNHTKGVIATFAGNGGLQIKYKGNS